MEKVVLQAENRDVTGKKVRALRREGKLPAVIYGNNVDAPIAIVMDAHDVYLKMRATTSSSLVTIELEGKEYPTLIREKQMDYLKNVPIHIDFLAVSLTEKIIASVGIHLEGDAPAVKEFGAILVTGLSELEVECLPTDLPERFVVDVSSLAEVSSGIHVRDIEAPANVEILTDPDEMIVVATYAAAEEVEEEALEALEGEEGEGPEVIEKGKKEEDEE